MKPIISFPTHFLDNSMVYSCTHICNMSLTHSPAIRNKAMLMLPFLIKTSPGVWDCKILVALRKTCVFLFIHTKNYLVGPLPSNWHRTLIYRPWSTKSYHTQCPFWSLEHFAILMSVPLMSGQNAHRGETEAPNLNFLNNFSNWNTFKLNFNCTWSKTRLKSYR
jgi:hypothetical protein